jgi:ABC-2 type transport system permease protein
MKTQMIALITIARAELNRFFRVWPQSLMPPVITMLLYFIVFGKFIGNQLNEIQGVRYMDFITPGLIMMSIIMSSYNNTVFSFFISRFHKSIEEILIAPVSNHTILLGFVIGGMTRGLLTGILVMLTSFFFTHTIPQHGLIIIISAMMASLFFSLAGLTNAIFSKKFDDISIIPTFVLTPLAYLGGIFYSIDQLPNAWQMVSYFNPIFYIISIFRYGFLGIETTPLIIGFLALGLFIVLIYSVNFYLLKRGVGIRN